jgi:DNA-binding PadR family transcriptional regulator
MNFINFPLDGVGAERHPLYKTSSYKGGSHMLDFDQCPCSGGTLSKLIQPGILTVLAERPLHGYRIVQHLARYEALGGSKPDVTGVYRALKIMQKRGLVTSRWDISGVGPAKHLYRLTRPGKECLARWTRTLREYHKAVGKLLRLARKASGNPRRHGSARTRTQSLKRAPRAKQTRVRARVAR